MTHFKKLISGKSSKNVFHKECELLGIHCKNEINTDHKKRYKLYCLYLQLHTQWRLDHSKLSSGAGFSIWITEKIRIRIQLTICAWIIIVLNDNSTRVSNSLQCMSKVYPVHIQRKSYENLQSLLPGVSKQFLDFRIRCMVLL